jgi:hypothetical protein
MSQYEYDQLEAALDQPVQKAFEAFLLEKKAALLSAE